MLSRSRYPVTVLVACLGLFVAAIGLSAHVRMGGDWWVVGPPLTDIHELWAAGYGDCLDAPALRIDVQPGVGTAAMCANQRVLIWHEPACAGRRAALAAWGEEGVKGEYTRASGAARAQIDDGPGYCVETEVGSMLLGAVVDTPHWEPDVRAGPGWPRQPSGGSSLGNVDLRLGSPPAAEAFPRVTIDRFNDQSAELSWLAPARYSRLLPAQLPGFDWRAAGSVQNGDEGGAGYATRFARSESFPPMVAMGVEDAELCREIVGSGHPTFAADTTYFLNRTATQFFDYGADGVACIVVMFGW